ncbi:hypothetical protein VZO05_14265 [Aggregatilineales bacterium SYSU G02658]
MPTPDGKWTAFDYLMGGAGIAAGFGLAYLQHKAKEEQIDKLISLPQEQGFAVVLEVVPPMNNEAWQDFQARLASRARTSERAAILLELARCIVREENEVSKLLQQYDFAQIRMLVPSLLKSKTLVQQLAFIVGLRTFANQGNLVAKAMLSEILSS